MIQKRSDFGGTEWITYAGALQHDVAYWLWKRTLCRLGIHLFDEVKSIHIINHESVWCNYLSCDACDVCWWSGDEDIWRELHQPEVKASAEMYEGIPGTRRMVTVPLAAQVAEPTEGHQHHIGFSSYCEECAKPELTISGGTEERMLGAAAQKKIGKLEDLIDAALVMLPDIKKAREDGLSDWAYTMADSLDKIKVILEAGVEAPGEKGLKPSIGPLYPAGASSSVASTYPDKNPASSFTVEPSSSADATTDSNELGVDEPKPQEVVMEFLDMLADEDVPIDFYWNRRSQCFLVNANDLFEWASADAEPIGTIKDVEVYRQALDDCRENIDWADKLYCCRKRKMRPQNCWFPDHPYSIAHGNNGIPEALVPLFKACGPERTEEECG